MEPFEETEFFVQLPLGDRGDFNEMLYDNEKQGGVARNPRLSEAFRDVLNDCNLVDAGFTGRKFTWFKNKKDPASMRERLDRFIFNTTFCDCLSHHKVSHLNLHFSDHRPIVIEFDWKSRYRKKKTRLNFYKYEESWLKVEGCKDVGDCWGKHGIVDRNNINVCVQNCLRRLHGWNKQRLNGTIQGAIDRKEKEIENLSKSLTNCRSPEILNAELDLEDLLSEEEKFWKIRSREDWLLAGIKIPSGFTKEPI